MCELAPFLYGNNIPYPQDYNINCFLSPNLACLQETWTGKEKITDRQQKTEGEEEQEEEVEEEEEQEMPSTSGYPKHDPEDL